jgi:hypothetical protein
MRAAHGLQGELELDSALDGDFRQLQCRPATAAECARVQLSVWSALRWSESGIGLKMAGS